MKIAVKLLIAAIALSMLAFGCKKKEEQPVPKAHEQFPVTTPMQDPMQRPMPPHGYMKPKSEKKIVVPEGVKAKWNKVKFVIEDKASKKSSEFTANIGSEINVPNTSLKISVGEFLPDFRMDESVITSASESPNNPAVRVEVFENGKSIFKGWLYSKFPAIHPFEHEKYGLVLKEGIKG